MVQALMRRLDEVSIDATVTTEYGAMESELGGELPLTIWVVDPRDWERALQILRDECANRTAIRCPNCGYDLRGHTGKGACPECGNVITAPTPEIICAHCGESLPATFELCWSCGGSVSPSANRDA
jgi:hypothetical protein